MAEKDRPPCIVDGCHNLASTPTHKYCTPHRERVKKGLPMDTPIRAYGMSASELRTRAALRLADVASDTNNDEEFRKAQTMMRVYGLRAVRMAQRKKP